MHMRLIQGKEREGELVSFCGVINKVGSQGGHPGPNTPLWLCEYTGLW